MDRGDDTLNLNRLKTFIAVVDEGGFSRAAATLGLTQPAVSMQLRPLEEEIGFTLVERHAEGVTFTAAGEILYAGARRALAILGETSARLKTLQESPGETLVVGSSTLPSECLLPSILGLLKRRFPAVAVMVEVADTAEVISRVSEGRLQVGIVGTRPRQQELKAEPVARDELVLVLPPDHMWENGAEVDPRLLLDQPFVVREQGSGTLRHMEAALEQLGISHRDLRVAARLGSTRSVVAAVSAGFGVSFVSRMAVADDARAGRVKVATLVGEAITRKLYAIWRREEENLPLIAAFRRVIAEYQQESIS